MSPSETKMFSLISFRTCRHSWILPLLPLIHPLIVSHDPEMSSGIYGLTLTSSAALCIYRTNTYWLSRSFVQCVLKSVATLVLAHYHTCPFQKSTGFSFQLPFLVSSIKSFPFWQDLEHFRTVSVQSP